VCFTSLLLLHTCYSGVDVVLEDGRTVHGDILIGADGIWSQVCTTLYTVFNFAIQQEYYSNLTFDLSDIIDICASNESWQYVADSSCTAVQLLHIHTAATCA
jgi:2-polyprenyl-6-methoxyphenol hydroxylase-like FAD-dependent oxidoreductase